MEKKFHQIQPPLSVKAKEKNPKGNKFIDIHLFYNGNLLTLNLLNFLNRLVQLHF